MYVLYSRMYQQHVLKESRMKLLKQTSRPGAVQLRLRMITTRIPLRNRRKRREQKALATREVGCVRKAGTARRSERVWIRPFRFMSYSREDQRATARHHQAIRVKVL
jgi:hypothetical protein